jgi:cytochrome c oxidase subunit 1
VSLLDTPEVPEASDLSADDFRTCPVTTFKVDPKAELLIKANAVAAVLCLTVGGIVALLMALTRWPSVALLSPEWFYRLVTLHGIDMLVAWIVFFEVAGLYFGAAVMLNSRLVAPKVAWTAFALMATGGGLANVIVLMGKADVMFTAYQPLEADPLFYLGVILFAVGALVAIGVFFGTIVVAKASKTFVGSLPLVVYGLMVAAIIGVYALLAGAIAFLPSFFHSIGWMETYDPAFYRNLFWGFGHSAQQINLAAMVAIWYALGQITVGSTPVNEKLSRFAFVCYLLFINLGSAHHLLVDPGPSFSWKLFNTSYFMYLAVLGSMIHAFSIPASLELAQRRRGFNSGLFGWLRRAPWGEPGFAALVVSMFIFGWGGGVTGVVLGTEQLNMLAHNTLRVPGHFHLTVVGGTTLAFMGLTYYLIPLIFRRELKLKGWAKWQPYMYGGGTVIMAVGMIASGIQGVARRSVEAADSIPGTVNLSLTFVGIGGVLAAIGGAMFVTIVLASILTGKRQEAQSLTLLVHPTPIPAAAMDEHPPAKGTWALVMGFLTFFVLFYAANWWLLGRTWGVG